MGSLLKFVLGLAIVAAVLWFGMSVRLGKHTLFGHFEAIFKSDETKDLVDGTRESIDPAVERVKRSVKAGMDEAARVPSPDAAPDAAAPQKAPAPPKRTAKAHKRR